MIKILLWLGLSIASGIAYHIAGIGGFPNAKLIRRLGCALIAFTLWIILSGFKIGQIWAYLGFLAFNYGVLTTYHDYIGKDNFYLTGLFYGLAALPIAIITGYWFGFGIRTLLLTGLIGYLRERTGKVFKEEFFSGLFYCGSIPILLI